MIAFPLHFLEDSRNWALQLKVFLRGGLYTFRLEGGEGALKNG